MPETTVLSGGNKIRRNQDEERQQSEITTAKISYLNTLLRSF